MSGGRAGAARNRPGRGARFGDARGYLSGNLRQFNSQELIFGFDKQLTQGVEIFGRHHLLGHGKYLHLLFVQMMGCIFSQALDFYRKMVVFPGKSLGILNDQFNDVMLVDRLQRVVTSLGLGLKKVVEIFFLLFLRITHSLALL